MTPLLYICCMGLGIIRGWRENSHAANGIWHRTRVKIPIGNWKISILIPANSFCTMLEVLDPRFSSQL